MLTVSGKPLTSIRHTLRKCFPAEHEMTKEELFWSIFHLIYLKTTSLPSDTHLCRQLAWSVQRPKNHYHTQIKSIRKRANSRAVYWLPTAPSPRTPLRDWMNNWLKKWGVLQSFSFHFDLFGWCWWRVKYLTLLLCFKQAVTWLM